MPAATSPTATVDSFDRLPWGSHLCHLYRGHGELLSAAIPFIHAGLRNGERCLWVTSDPPVARRRTFGGDDALAELFAGGQIEIVHERNWRADAARRCREAIAAGYRGLRVAADMACLGSEEAVDRMIGLCSFPIDGCTSRSIFELIDTHPQVLVRDGVRWAHIATGMLRMRDDVVSLVSHELKTPLASLRLRIDGLMRKVRAGAATEDEIEHRLVKAIEQCDRLDALVTNLLDVSRVHNGKLPILLEPDDLGRVVRATAEKFGEEFGDRGSALVVETESIPGRWDRTRVEQMVTNLLSNALRHAPGAPVWVSASRRGRFAVIEVRDRGPGISPDLVDGIFDRFAPVAHSRQGGGLGLGLWIVREIVAALGGTISVFTEPGVGSEFTIALPPGAEDDAPAPTEPT